MGIFIASLVQSCTKSDHYYRDFIKEASRQYVGKVDSVQAYPGRNRIKLSWLLSPDQSVRSTHIYWNNGRDSLIQIMNRQEGIDTSEVTIEDLDEGNHAFTIYTYGDNHNRSIGVEVFAKAYGSIYEQNLSNRVVKSIARNAEAVTITWFDEFSETLRATEITYLDAAGSRQLHLLFPDENTIILHDLPPGGTLEYRSVHTPESLAIDTFYSSAATLTVE